MARNEALINYLWNGLRYSDAVSGWAGGALAHPEFGSSITLFQPRGGADYTHHITDCPPGFENLTALLVV